MGRDEGFVYRLFWIRHYFRKMYYMQLDWKHWKKDGGVVEDVAYDALYYCDLS